MEDAIHVQHVLNESFSPLAAELVGKDEQKRLVWNPRNKVIIEKQAQTSTWEDFTIKNSDHTNSNRSVLSFNYSDEQRKVSKMVEKSCMFSCKIYSRISIEKDAKLGCRHAIDRLSQL